MTFAGTRDKKGIFLGLQPSEFASSTDRLELIPLAAWPFRKAED